jgi:hypothetical protein
MRNCFSLDTVIHSGAFICIWVSAEQVTTYIKIQFEKKSSKKILGVIDFIEHSI